LAKVARKTLFRARKLRRTLTDAETVLWSRLRGDIQGFRFRRQHPIGSYIADFASIAVRLVVEVDGGTHSSDAECAYDARREAFLRSKGWRIIRVWNGDVYDSPDDIVSYICDVARSIARELSSTRRG
jgi:very-short-patch-repair endonuclease